MTQVCWRLTQESVTRHQVVVFPANRKFNSHSKMSLVSKYLAHQPHSVKGYRSLHNIFIVYLEKRIYICIGTMIGMNFFRQCFCRFLPLKFASKTRTFQLCFVHTKLCHNCTSETSLDLHSLSVSRPSVNTASSVTCYTVHRQTQHKKRGK